MKEVNAELIIKVILDCPHCDEPVDLVADWDERCEVLEETLDLNGNGLGCEDLELCVACPECGKDFMVREVIW